MDAESGGRTASVNRDTAMKDINFIVSNIESLNKGCFTNTLSNGK